MQPWKLVGADMGGRGEVKNDTYAFESFESSQEDTKPTEFALNPTRPEMVLDGVCRIGRHEGVQLNPLLLVNVQVGVPGVP